MPVAPVAVLFDIYDKDSFLTQENPSVAAYFR
jgi:hypothetical protein